MTNLTRAILPALFITILAVPSPAQTSPTQTHGISIANMDTAVRPGDNFYLYANGGYIARTKLPADRASLGVFTMLDDLSSKRIASIIDDAAKATAPANSDKRKIADLYHSYMDEAAIESHGLAALKPHLDAIAAIKTQRELARALGLSLRADVDPLNNTNYHTSNIFGLWVASSFNDSDHYAPYLLQGGIEMPDRDYYLSDSPHMKEIRTKYQTHIATMFRLAGIADGETRAARVVALETAIAKVQTSLADSENIEHANNPWTAADFRTKAPGLDWNEFFRAAGLDKQQVFIVWQPGAFSGEAALVASQPLDAWKDLLAYHLIEDYAAGISKALASESFAFMGQTLNGTPAQRPRNIRGDRFVSARLGDAVGKIYAQRYFPPQAKAQAQALVSNLLAAFHQRLENVTWMAPATKAEALAKLGTLQVGIGYPDHWRSYAGYEVSPDNLFENIWRSDLFEYHYSRGRIGQPVDRKEWCMTPQTVNAVNLPLDNGLNFPAAILQPPYFDANAPDADNYGAIGAVIGHEVSHSFDDQGSQFDAAGKLTNWWGAEDFAHFKAASARLVAQYNAYKPLPDLSINGQQTLSENIADVAGLAASYDAYRMSLKGRPAPEQQGFSGDQQFFISFAQSWREKMREPLLRLVIVTDGHSPSEYRADTVRNLDPWYDAFGVKPGEHLYLPQAERVRIW